MEPNTPPQQPIVQSETPPPQLLPKKRSRLPLIISLALFFLIILFGGGYVFLANRSQPVMTQRISMPSQPAVSPSATPVPTIVAEIGVTTETLRLLIQQLIDQTDMTLVDTVKAELTGEYAGCQITGVYKSTVKNENAYGLQDYTYPSETAGDMCERNSLYALYTETYWIGKDRYNKQYKDKPFEKLKPDSQLATAKKGNAYLKEIFANPQSLTVTSQEKKEATIVVHAVSTVAEKKTIYQITIDTAKNQITKIVYSGEQANPDNKNTTMVFSGDTTIFIPGETITFDPAGL